MLNPRHRESGDIHEGNHQMTKVYFCTLLMAALALCGGVALAQQMPKQLPVEADLRSAYCSAVLTGHLQTWNGQDSSDFDDAAKKVSAEIAAELEDDLRRLKSYLLPRLKYVESLGISAAVERGKADMARVMQEAVNCGNECKVRADNKNFTKDYTCTGKCMEGSAAKKRTDACDDLSFLPF